MGKRRVGDKDRNKGKERRWMKDRAGETDIPKFPM